jgi:hypothetical protein
MQTYELQEIESGNYDSKYQKIESHTVDPVRPLPYSFFPKSPPKYITVLSPTGEVPSLWLWSILCRGGQGFLELNSIVASFSMPGHLHEEHVRVIRQRKSNNFFYKMAAFEGCLDSFLHMPPCRICLNRKGFIYLHRDLNLPLESTVGRISRPPTCGYLPEDTSQSGYVEPVTDESADEEGPDLNY